MRNPETDVVVERDRASTPSAKTASGGERPDARSTGRHLNASFLRDDSWETLRSATGRLADDTGGDEARQAVAAALRKLESIESYWAFPGKAAIRQLRDTFEEEDWPALARRAARITRLLASGTYRRIAGSKIVEERRREEDAERGLPGGTATPHAEVRPYFEVLLVDELSEEDEQNARENLLALRTEEDPFVYDVVIVPSIEDALIAVLFNYNIQGCVLRYSLPYRSEQRLEELRAYLSAIGPHALDEWGHGRSSLMLGRLLREVRPELDLFLVTDTPVEEIAGSGHLPFRRIFYRQEDYSELHSNLLKGVADRYRTPFFAALKSYSQRPTGVFHAMPLSRGKSIARSHWIQDMARFYGNKIFQAETSATTGGLDSLLQPQGTLREAQDLAARAFGAKSTYFVTNGTSAANKIVAHALLRPDDIALVARDCHKSHHYAMQLAGARPLYLDPYPLSDYSFYGAVPLRQIKQQLLELKKAGKLDRTRMLLLTNCTFDGITYDPERVMAECLAIKPDLIFLWDEAWFAFATFHPTLRRRTAMSSARRLRERLRSEEYAERYAAWKEQWDALPDDDARWLNHPLMPPPEARLRVYATQSTHKTLTALRQGSMIHIYDQDFERLSAEAFNSSYMTYTSTSPNYQILASLDIGRRQVELEGYELVQRSLELAMVLRRRLESHALLRKYFKVLRPADVVPEEFRPSGLEGYYDREAGWSRMETAWDGDEFALDPTRVTLHIACVGMDGDTFKKHLMDAYDTQINKTSRNTVLFMVHIGTSRGAVAHLIEVLTRIAESLEEHHEDLNPAERQLYERKVKGLTEDLPPLPNFSRFHHAFCDGPEATTREGDLRSASFLAYDGDHCEYLLLDGAVQREMERGREIVSAGFVTPYPPGFPVLVPGQILSPEIRQYLAAIDVKEIHGYQPEYGLRVFSEQALEDYEAERKAAF